ncbi:MAG: AMP-binding protein [Proteobacteria bacterium]|nr:AMP-binding protein [Pseudomonadota bacterium]
MAARERNEGLLCDLVQARAGALPDLEVLTFESNDSGCPGAADEVRTYSELARNGNAVAAWLVERGMQRGERFGLMLRNHPEFVETMTAASQSACVSVPIDPRTRGDKLAYTLRDAGCRGVVCADYCVESVEKIRDQCPGIEWILLLESGEGDSLPIAADIEDATSFAEVLGQDRPVLDVRLQSDRDPLQIIYTSGTTGDPKGVVFSNERFAGFAFLGPMLGYNESDRPYTGLSLTHGNAQAVTLGPSLFMGLRGVFSRRFTKSRLWSVCRRLGCTTFSLLGGMATAIYAEPEHGDDADNPVRMVISAGMPAAIWESFEKRFGVDLFEWYGAIEGGLAFKPLGEGPVGSFGRPAPGLEMKIVDERGEVCPPGVPGEIVSRPEGATAEVEYYGNEKASAAKVEGGWLRSGDIGHTDEEGWMFFDYRKGGGIRHNGDFINPGFVEKAVAEYPQVSDVFVYGVKAESGSPGEKDVVAVVVPTDGLGGVDGFNAPGLFAFCREKLEANFVPTWLQLVEEIPKTASEKPQERFLLERFAPGAPNIHKGG